jgi:O-antigen/teichoic acid export membrane protein
MFVLTPLLVHSLGNERYGIWLVLFSITNYFNLSSFGFGQTFIIELIKSKNKLKQINVLINTFFGSLLIFSATTLPVFLFIQYFLIGTVIKISPNYLSEATKSFWIIYLVFLTNFISQVFYNVLFARNKLSIRNFIEVSKVVLSFIGTWFAIQNGGGLVLVSMVTFLVTFLYVVALYIACRIDISFDLSFSYFSLSRFKKFLKPSLQFFVMGLSHQIIVHSYTILVSSLQSAALVVVYTVALRIPDTSMRLILKIADVKVPKITSLFHDGDWRALWLLHNRLFWITFFVSLGIGGLLLVWGPAVIYLWMGKDFEFNYILFAIFLFNMFMQCVVHVPGVFLQSMGMNKRASIFYVVGTPISIFLAWFLSKSHGLEGIAIGLSGVQILVQLCIIPEFYNLVKREFVKKGWALNLFQLKN